MKLGNAIVFSLILHLLLVGIASSFSGFRPRITQEPKKYIDVEFRKSLSKIAKRVKVKRKVEPNEPPVKKSEERTKKENAREVKEDILRDRIIKVDSKKVDLDIKKEEAIRNVLERFNTASNVFKQKQEVDVAEQIKQRLMELETKANKVVDNTNNRQTSKQDLDKDLVQKIQEKTESKEKLTAESKDVIGIEVNQSEFPFTWYLNVLRNKVYNNWVIPNEHFFFKQPEPAIIRITVDRTGSIKDMDKVKLSGVDKVDRSILAAMAGLIRLPPLPSDYKKDLIEFNITFDIEERINY
ncbi:MAG: cell envelope integrity protein TolA [bacterium]